MFLLFPACLVRLPSVDAQTNGLTNSQRRNPSTRDTALSFLQPEHLSTTPLPRIINQRPFLRMPRDINTPLSMWLMRLFVEFRRIHEHGSVRGQLVYDIGERRRGVDETGLRRGEPSSISTPIAEYNTPIPPSALRAKAYLQRKLSRCTS